MQSEKMTYNPRLDGLRALAIILVLIYHFFPAILTGGFIGVDVFFILSGYLITHNILYELDRGSFSFINFYKRRITRLYPALLTCIVGTYFLALFTLMEPEFLKFLKHIISSNIFFQNFNLAMETGYFDTNSLSKPLLHFWSLSLEEQFYFIYPILIILTPKGKRSLTTILIIAITFFLNVFFRHHENSNIYFLPQYRLWEPALGSLLAITQRDLSLKRFFNLKLNELSKTLLFCSGLTLISFSAFFINKKFAFPGYWAIFPAIGTLLIIEFNKNLISNFIFNNKIMITIGKISYPVYLWHWPILSLAWIASGGEEMTPIFKLGLISLTFFLSFLTYQFIEERIRHSKNKLTPNLLFVCSVFLTIIASLQFKGIMPLEEILVNKGIKSYEKIRGSIPTNNQSDTLLQVGYKDFSNKILLFGDSHANHYARAILEKFGDKFQIDILYSSQCYMGKQIDGISILKLAGCKKSKQFLKTMKKEYDIIITSQRWHGYSINNKEIAKKSIEDRIAVIRKFNYKSAYIIGSTNDIDYQCETGKMRKINFVGNCKKNEVIEVYTNIFKNAALNLKDKLDRNQITFLNPSDFICPNKKCKLLSKKNEFLYTDNHHLSIFGAREVIKNISAPEKPKLHKVTLK